MTSPSSVGTNINGLVFCTDDFIIFKTLEFHKQEVPGRTIFADSKSQTLEVVFLKGIGGVT